MRRKLKPGDLGKYPGILSENFRGELSPLRPEDTLKQDFQKESMAWSGYSPIERSLDGVSAIGMKELTGDEAEKLVRGFRSGLRKLLNESDNWAFLGPLRLSLEYCVQCLTCADACPIYIESGRNPIYNPVMRSEALRQAVAKWGYVEADNEPVTEDDYRLTVRLMELSYRCTLCRRCAQACPLALDNALLTREIRKLFSQELGVAPKEIHRLGSERQLATGSSTGLKREALFNMVEFARKDFERRTGISVEIPWDKEGADVLLIHNAGEFLAWPDNPIAIAALLNMSGISWTLSSEIAGYDAVNYGLWYDDAQFARLALRLVETAKRLKVGRIVVGECGHAHKAIIVTADRMIPPSLNVPRESWLPLLREIILKGRLELDPALNDFDVVLHDPCNIVRNMGIVKPQREVLDRIAPQWLELTPHGVEGYCCGGGSGFALMGSYGFKEWRTEIAGRAKWRQICDATRSKSTSYSRSYICAPCSNCKGQLRDVKGTFDSGNVRQIVVGGLSELVVNALPAVGGRLLAGLWIKDV